jgi:CheY-like chemotaxis protein
MTDETTTWTPEMIRKLQHDLRNPLTAVMGFSQLLESTDLDDQQRSCVERVIQGAQRLLDMIDKIPERATPPSVGPSVLYIEDDPTNVTLIEGILSHRPKVTLRSATDAASGLAAARETTPSLVLLDLGLPDRPGAEVLSELRADPRTASVPVVVLSGDNSPETIAQLTAAGAEAYLTKPLDIVEFLEIVDEVTA